MSAYQPDAPVEDVNRGTVVALLAVPVGVIVFVVVWTIGFIASIITLGVAYLAMFLYRLGSGGGMSRAGAVRVTIITLVTLALSIFAGLVTDIAIGVGRSSKTSPVEAVLEPGFWSIFEDNLANADGQLWMSVGLAALFGVIGCFGILRSAFGSSAPATEAHAQSFAPPAQPTEEQAPPIYGQQQYGEPQPPEPGAAPRS